MTLSEIKAQVMFQTNNDSDDLADFEPHIGKYVNDGYDRLVFAWAHSHVSDDSTEYPTLTEGTDVPNLPEWTHEYLADWATWLVYRNGNPQKQQRGYAFRQSFEEALSKIYGSGGAAGLNSDGTQKQYRNFINIPR